MTIAPLLALPAATVVALASTAAGQVFTVDDDGPADFAEITDAIASPLVADGDRLVVAPGSYDAFVLTKALEIVGVAERAWYGLDLPTVASGSRVEDVEGFALVGLDLQELFVARVPGRGRIEGCDLTAYWGGGLVAVDCGGLVVSGSHLLGRISCYPDGPNQMGPAASVRRSTVVFSGCTLQGGGEDGGGGCATHYGTGAWGLALFEGSYALVSDCDVRGYPWSIVLPVSAIHVEDSELEVRGVGDRVIHATWPGESIELAGTATAVVSGANLVPPPVDPGVVVLETLRPHLRRRGGLLAGDVLAVELFGPPGAPAWLCLGAPGAPTPFPGSRVPVLVDLDSLLDVSSLSTLGRATAVGPSVPLPTEPALVGLPLTAQAVGLSPDDGALVPSGPVDVTLRPPDAPRRAGGARPLLSRDLRR
jgi:hypothetical protein